MLMLALALAASFAAQAPPPAPDPVVLSAGLGGCSADFTVTGADGQPVYAALIRTTVRYGFMSVKKMELEISTGSDGKARISGLPLKGKAVEYSVMKGPERGSATQDLKDKCNASFSIALK